MSLLHNWEQWKDFLDNRINDVEKLGVSDQVITNIAVQVGEYLSNQVEPKNEQERVLAELWEVANDDEQRAIANMMVKLVQQ